MKDNNNILDKIGRNDGLKVPDGYFESFAQNMIDSLPPRPEAEEERKPLAPRTFWGRVRPYVYMAAMFAGIWCMLKMFTMMYNTNVDLSLENNEVLTEALSDDNFVYDHILDDITQREIIDDLYDDDDFYFDDFDTAPDQIPDTNE